MDTFSYLCFFFLIGISAHYGPFKKISGISKFANFLISHHNLEHVNKLVISERMLFSNLSYIFYNSDINHSNNQNF